MTLPSTAGAVRCLYIDGPWGQVHVRYAAPVDGGDHRPCILFSAASSSAVVFEPLLAELGRDRVAVAFDTPGYGQSVAPTEPVERISVFADFFRQALANLVEGPADAFGHHSGALLALALAGHHRNAVGRIVVTGVPFLVDAASRRIRRETVGEIVDAGVFRRYLERSYAYWITDRSPEIPFSSGMRLFADSLTPGDRLNDLSRAIFADGAEAWLTSISAPVLYLQIDDVMSDNSLLVARLTPYSTIRERPDLDHLSFISSPLAFARELRDFFDLTPPAPPVSIAVAPPSIRRAPASWR